jgi:hypothetical protein
MPSSTHTDEIDEKIQTEVGGISYLAVIATATSIAAIARDTPFPGLCLEMRALLEVLDLFPQTVDVYDEKRLAYYILNALVSGESSFYQAPNDVRDVDIIRLVFLYLVKSQKAVSSEEKSSLRVDYTESASLPMGSHAAVSDSFYWIYKSTGFLLARDFLLKPLRAICYAIYASQIGAPRIAASFSEPGYEGLDKRILIEVAYGPAFSNDEFMLARKVYKKISEAGFLKIEESVASSVHGQLAMWDFRSSLRSDADHANDVATLLVMQNTL